MDDIRGDDSEKDQADGQKVKCQSAFLEGVEKSGADLKSDGENEEDKSEFLEEVKEGRIGTEAEVAHEDTDKEYPGGAEGYALDFYPAQKETGGYHKCQEHDGMSGPLTKK